MKVTTTSAVIRVALSHQTAGCAACWGAPLASLSIRAGDTLKESGCWQVALYGAHAGPAGIQTTLVDLEKWSENFYRPKVGTAELLRLGQHDAVLHTGVTVGTRAAFVRFPAHDTTLVLLCNRMDVNTERLAAQVADVLFK